ncbi:MAG: tetratricopeptide repeat protein [Phycisphaerae bacterium]
MASVATGVLAVLTAAIAGCGTAWDINTHIADHYAEKGARLAETGDYDAALEELTKAVKFNERCAAAHETAGDIHRRRGDYDQARESYEDACESDPYAFRSHYNLGVVYQSLSGAARKVKDAREYLHKAVSVYLRAVTLEPDDFDANLNLGVCYYQLGRYGSAEKYTRAAAKLRPDSAQAAANLGVILDSRGKPFQAIRSYKRSVELEFNQPAVLMNIGAIYVKQSRLPLALRYFEQARDQAPGSAAVHEQLGGCHYHMGNYDAAERAYRKAISLEPRSDVAHRGLGVVLMSRYVSGERRRELREEALDAWMESLEINPEQPKLVALVEKYQPQTASEQL